MDFTIIFLIVEGVYIAGAAALGLALTRRGRPYKVLLPVFHVVFALLILLGMVSDLVVGLPTYRLLPQVTLSISALALLSAVSIGITMLVRKTRSMKLVDLHKWAVIVFVTTLVVGQGFVLFKV